MILRKKRRLWLDLRDIPELIRTEVAAMAAVTASVATCVQQLVDYRADESDVAADARHRLARDLNSVLSQHLSALGNKVDTLAAQTKTSEAAVISPDRIVVAVPPPSAVVDTPDRTMLAARALISAYDQLTAVVTSTADNREVVLGQRDNLVETLSVLGVVQIEPQIGERLNPRRAIADARTVPTSESSRQGCVAVVDETGWDLADGSAYIRLPRVRVFALVAEATGDQR